MADSTTILNWIQSGGVLAALIFTALEVRARRKEQHFRNYSEGIAGFIEDTRLLIENKALFGLYTTHRKISPNNTKNFQTIKRRGFIIAIQSSRAAKRFGLVQRIALFRKMNGNIEKSGCVS